VEGGGKRGRYPMAGAIGEGEVRMVRSPRREWPDESPDAGIDMDEGERPAR